MRETETMRKWMTDDDEKWVKRRNSSLKEARVRMGIKKEKT